MNFNTSGYPGRLRYLLSVCLLFPFFVYAGGEYNHEERVLVINSYSPLKEDGNHIISSLIHTLRQNVKVQVTSEHMDCESSSDFGAWTNWMTSLCEAYEQPPCVVVVLGGEAWSAYRKACPEAWKKIPVVLGNVKKGYIDYEKWAKRQIETVDDIPGTAKTFDDFKVTGYYLTDYLEQSLHLAVLLQPNLKKIACYYDDRYQHHFFEPYLQSLIAKTSGLNLHYWPGSSLTTSGLIDSIAAIDKTYAVFSFGWYTDVNDYHHAYSMLDNALSLNPELFVYNSLDQDFNNPNYLGGYFVSGKEIGNDLGLLIADLLEHGIENIPAFGPTPSLPHYHLNHKVFTASGLNPSRLPEDVVWHNAELTLFEKYPTEVTFAWMLLLLLLVVSVHLLLMRRRRMRSVIALNQRMTNLLEGMPDMAVIFDKDQNISDIVNPQRDVLLDFTREQLIGMNIADLDKKHPEFEEVAARICGYVRKTAESQTSFSFNYEITFSDKTYYAEARTVPLDTDKVICYAHDVTPSVIAKQEVVKLKNFLQSIIDHLPIGLLVKDASDEFRYLYYNHKAVEYHGGVVADYLGRNEFEVGTPWANQYYEEDIRVLNSDEPIAFERQIICKGESRSIVTTKTRVINNDGSRYIIVILVDTTYLRKNEAELENTRNELSIALDAGSLAAWIYNIADRWFTSLYNETVSGTGMTFEAGYEMVHPDDREKYNMFMDDLISERCERKCEIMRFIRDGEYDWYETHATVSRSKETGEIYQIIGTEKNITDDLRQQKELEESRFKTDLVIQSNGIVLWDYDLITRTFSSPNVNSFMYHGMAYDQFLTLVHPDDVPLFTEALNKIIAGSDKTVSIQTRVLFPGVGYRWVENHAVGFAWDTEGHLTQVTGLRRDITEWKNVTEELISLRDKAEESNRLKTAFLANMSHEIRTPLNAIVGFSNLIAQTENPDEVKEYCRIIETNNDLLLQLINDILDLSKIEAGQLEFVYSDIQVISIFTNLEQIYRMRVQEGVDLVCVLPASDCIIHSEKNRLTQVLSNFLSNACKFTSKGSIKMGFEYTGKGLRFFVTDTGKGVACENIEHVFDRFMKFDAFVQGTGLGLSICQTIVNRLGGEIGVDTELGKGSTFWFTIPCHVEIIGETVSFSSIPLASAPDSDKGQQKLILIAEDNESNYYLLSSILKKNYRLERAINGKEVVRLHAVLQPHLILMDIRMPEMDGLEATAEIRKTDTVIPIIALTANAFDEDRERAFQAGCNDYLTKPVGIKQLLDLLNSYL